jgi:hypothetical protein
MGCQCAFTLLDAGQSPESALVFRSGEASGIGIECCLSVAPASRARLSTFLDGHGSAITVPVSTHTRAISIMVAIKSIIVTLANAIAPAFANTDAVGTDRHFSLG